MAERFVRPPITFSIHFKTPVFLSNISFCTAVGYQHRSNLFEVYAAPYSENFSSSTYVKIGRANLINHKEESDHSLKSNTSGTSCEDKCIFKNFRFPGNKLSIEARSTQHSSQKVFRLSNSNNLLEAISHIKVVILKTTGSCSSPGISDLKLFGRISLLYRHLNISEVTVQKIHSTWLQIKATLTETEAPTYLNITSF